MACWAIEPSKSIQNLESIQHSGEKEVARLCVGGLRPWRVFFDPIGTHSPDTNPSVNPNSSTEIVVRFHDFSCVLSVTSFVRSWVLLYARLGFEGGTLFAHLKQVWQHCLDKAWHTVHLHCLKCCLPCWACLRLRNTTAAWTAMLTPAAPSPAMCSDREWF